MGDDEGEKSVAHTFFDAGDTRLLCAGGDGGLVEGGVLRGTGMVSDCLVGSDGRHCDGEMAVEMCRAGIAAQGRWLLVGDRGWRQAREDLLWWARMWWWRTRDKLTVQACCPFGGSCCRSWSRIIQWKNARTGKVMWVGSWCAVVERSLLEVFDAGDAKLEGKQSNPLERPFRKKFLASENYHHAGKIRLPSFHYEYTIRYFFCHE